MVKLKKVLVMALSFVMAMTAFVACGGDKEFHHRDDYGYV